MTTVQYLNRIPNANPSFLALVTFFYILVVLLFVLSNECALGSLYTAQVLRELGMIAIENFYECDER